MVLTRRAFALLAGAVVSGTFVGCAPTAEQEPIAPEPGMKTAVLNAKGMH